MSESVASKESAEECRRFIRDAENPRAPLRGSGASDGDAHARRLSGDPAFFAIALAEVMTPLAMRPGPPSFSLAKMKIGIAYGDVLASIHCLCALNANVSALERSLICHAS